MEKNLDYICYEKCPNGYIPSPKYECLEIKIAICGILFGIISLMFIFMVFKLLITKQNYSFVEGIAMFSFTLLCTILYTALEYFSHISLLIVGIGFLAIKAIYLAIFLIKKKLIKKLFFTCFFDLILIIMLIINIGKIEGKINGCGTIALASCSFITIIQIAYLVLKFTKKLLSDDVDKKSDFSLIDSSENTNKDNI